MDPIDPIELYIDPKVLQDYETAVNRLHHAIAGRRHFDRHSPVNEQLFTALMWAKCGQHWLTMAAQQAAAEHTGAPQPFGLDRL